LEHATATRNLIDARYARADEGGPRWLQIAYGIESCSRAPHERVKNEVAPPAYARDAAHDPRRGHPRPRANMMIGHPTERSRTLERRRKFSRSVELDLWSGHEVHAYPGTPAYPGVRNKERSTRTAEQNAMKLSGSPEGSTKRFREAYFHRLYSIFLLPAECCAGSPRWSSKSRAVCGTERLRGVGCTSRSQLPKRELP